MAAGSSSYHAIASGVSYDGVDFDDLPRDEQIFRCKVSLGAANTEAVLWGCNHLERLLNMPDQDVEALCVLCQRLRNSGLVEKAWCIFCSISDKL